MESTSTTRTQLNSYDVNAIQNGHEDVSKSVEVNMTGLEAAEFDGTSRKIICTRRRLLRPKWRKKVSFRSPRNGNLNNGTFPIIALLEIAE